MNRLKLLATATLLALTFTACDEGTPPPVEPPPPPTPVGTLSGTVTIEGTAASGITATLSSGATTTTGSGGNFAFSGVEAGTYTVTISGFPEDATFAEVTQSATISTDGQNVQLTFAGEYIRSSAVVGSVVAADAMMSGGDGQPETLGGVTVTLSGEHAMGETMETDVNGGFAFTGLRAGTYTVTISDFPEDVSFETVMVEVAVEVGDVGQADFTGHFIRTSAVEGQVIIEGEGLAGVTVTLSGGPADESYTMMTDADGMYLFEELRPGSYTVSISDFDSRDYEFAATSQDVSVDLDETGTVSFTGVLLRTSGVAGRVSVEGMGLGEVAVTLSGAADRSTMTDAGGQYAFAGLAAGDYTVSIAVESAAYVFESMSSDVTVGDDESAIVNFEGAHARTASVSGMVFIDEATKNDMFDEGENALAQAGIPVVLVGPGVNQQQLGATNADGQFSFTGLRAGPYQLVVTISAEVAAALAAEDLAYGGPATGYAFALGVGEEKSQSIPFDITHTTVNFSVSLRSGDDEGAALPGATVTLYADTAGETKVGGGETGDDGSVAIKVARAGTSGNTVHAGVAADGYHVAGGKTAVSWDPQMFATAGANENDIVNLNVDATVSGATVTTEYGGGKALAGWAMSVTSGEDAVDGAPEKLDDDGDAAFKTSVGADDLPATFTFAVAADQADTLDGGEAYKGTAVEYTHTGLALAGTADAGTIEVAYTTQTLKVYVHHEKDQVEGYTGNILGGDARVSGMVDVGIRHIDDNGRSRSFTRAQWNPATEGNFSDLNGVVTFRHVPADANVVVKADEAAEGIKLLDPDELAAYRNMEENGVAGGAFGANGGFHHTVELCPLQATEPAGQDHGECASFAYVTMHTVSGLVWKRGVTIDPESDGFKVGAGNGDPTFVPGTTVNVSPVEGKNLSGDEESHTTTEKPVRTPGENTAGTSILDETHQFRFAGMAAGVYKVSLPSGWRYRIGGKGSEAKDNGELSPLADHVSLDVTPSTATLYGRLTGTDGFALDSVTVVANNASTMTDAHGRYILEGIVPQTRRLDNITYSNKIFLQAGAASGFINSRIRIVDFAANAPSEQNIDLSGVQARATISGTVRASGTNAPVAGALILVDGKAPANAPTRGVNAGKLLTGADGTYTAIIAAKALGATAMVSASKKGMSFQPPNYPVAAHAGAESRADFTGYLHATISGRVVAPAGGPMPGVTVTATSTVPGTTAAAAEVTTGVTGTFRLSVPFGGYTIAASAANHVFGYPATGQLVSVAPGQSVNFGAIQAKTAMARNVTAGRLTETTDDVTAYTGTIKVTWTANAGDVPDGYSDAAYTIQTNTGAADTWDDQSGATVDAANGEATFDIVNDDAFMVRVVATATNGQGGTLTLPSASVAVGAVDPSASGASAARSGDTIKVSWSAVTNNGSNQRVVIQVSPAALNGTSVWFVADNGDPASIASGTRAWSLTVADDFSTTWTAVGGANVTITAADLNKAVNVAVESVQGTVSDTNPWKRSAVQAVGAKP